MHRASRALTLSFVALVALGGCKRKKPETVVTPVTNTPAPAPTQPAADPCNAACRDSIARADNDTKNRAAIAEATARLTATIFFDLDRSDITDDGRAKLDAKVPVLTQNSAVKIRIAGHTDSRGSDE
jgi:outer membrane protein OmpA-like peptidoglycan-associated protein